MLKLKDIRIDLTTYSRWGKAQTRPMITDINLTVNPGEIVALVGGSGEGKSLLLLSILGLLPDGMHTGGTMVLNDKTILEKDREALRGTQLAYIPQSVSALNPLLTVAQQMQHCARRHNKPARRDDLARCLAQFQLDESVLDLYPAALSGGMAKRVLAAFSLLMPASLILADEMTAWLDLKAAQELLSVFHRLTKQGKSLLWVTHDLNLAINEADRVALLENGTITVVQDCQSIRAGLGDKRLQMMVDTLPNHDFIEGLSHA